MKYFSRTNEYKASNVKFEVETKRAYSYGYWKFTDVINGKLVFNSYSYSNSTARHQAKVRDLFDDLNIEVDLVIDFCREGLQDITWRYKTINSYRQEIRNLIKAVKSKGTRKTTNEYRRKTICEYWKTYKAIQALAIN